MENVLRIILGLVLIVGSILSIVIPTVVPIDLALWAKISAIVLGLWLLSGMMQEQAYFILRLLIGATFAYAAIDKIIHPDQFARIIYNYHIMPGQLINAFALLLPWIELIAGIFITIGFWEKAAAVIIGGLLAMFVIALSIALVKGVNIECGCFSTTSRAKGPVKDLIVRDVVLFLSCGLLFLARKSWMAVERRTSRR